MPTLSAPAPHAITGNQKAYLYCLAGVGRAGATRANYTASTVFIAIGGVQYGQGRANKATRVLVESLTISDTLNEDPNTCAMRTKGFVPAAGADVVITLGSRNNLRREFGGKILSTTQTYWDNPAQDEYLVSAIDYTWGLNTRKVYGRYTGTADAIVRALLAAYAPTYATTFVQSGLPIVPDGITFTAEDLTNALSQLAKRIGAHWYVGYNKDVHFFLTDTSATDPRPLTLTHPTARELAIRRDVSQWVTRGLVEGGGVPALASVAVGETLIPVENVAWYPESGGVIASGPQRVTYGGIFRGGASAATSGGGFPAVPLVAALAADAGAVDLGVHRYAYTFLTASGETLPGPLTAITVGALGPPATAPTAGAPQVGPGGPNPGTHDYAVTFVTASGETTAGPRLQVATALAAAPGTTPTPTLQAGAGIDVGTHEYAVTFLSSLGGETTPGPIGSVVTTSSSSTTTPNAGPPAMIANGPSATEGDLTPGQTYGYAVCHSTQPSSGDHSAQTGAVNFTNVPCLASTTNPAKSSHILLDIGAGPPQVKWLHLYRVNQTIKPGNNPADYRLVASYANTGGVVRHTDTASDAAIAAAHAPSGTNTVPPVVVQIQQVQLTSIPKGGAGIAARRLYRRSGGAGLRLLASIGDNTTTTYLDTIANASLGAAPPAASTAYATNIPLANLPLGGPLVTGRRIYRCPASGALKLATTITDNATTTWLDTVAEGALGAAPPATSTANATSVQLSQIQPSSAGATVIARRVYRTIAGASALRLLTELSDNTTTTYVDKVADGALLGPAPTADTSGLKQPEGSVLAGATTIPVSGAAWARLDGGWAIIGNGQQVIRYTGVSGNALVGVPPSGDGAITATISYNSSITHASMLTGIPASGAGAIRFRIVQGDDVNVFATFTDTASAQALAALIGGDGIQEDFLQDRRLSYGEALARAQALVALHAELDVAVHCTVRDLNAHAGRTLQVDLAAPFNVTATLLIQRSTGTYALPGQVPLYTIEASAARFTFEDLLRTARMTRGT